jgi:hypothetical protein
LTPFAASTGARLWKPAPIPCTSEVSEIAVWRSYWVQIAYASHLAPMLPGSPAPMLPAIPALLLSAGLAPLLPAHLGLPFPEALLLVPGPSKVRPASLLPEELPLVAGPSALGLAKLTVSSPTARRSLMTRFRV